jgi:membrane protease YdiL (CAAX protease family)
MGFFKKSDKASYDFLYGYAWHVPNLGGAFLMLVLLLAGALVGNLVELIFALFMPVDMAMTYGMPVAYVIMFIPAMMVSHSISLRNMGWSEGYALDNNHFQPSGGLALAIASIIGIISLEYCIDLVNYAMPDMPKKLEELMESMTNGDSFWINFLSVSILAPIFEEWLCRGTVLRGLLNCKKENGANAFKPVWAIVISALFFAIIHLNPWQGIPAFLIGCFMGYVYYKTGSLKLTMLIHFTNNTMALILSNIDSMEQYNTVVDMFGMGKYLIGFVFAAVVLFFCLRAFVRIKPERPSGSCRIVGNE